MNPAYLELVQFLFWPFVMCLLLAGIHCYLGLHVLAREVIFVDLSLAQIAALGTTFAVWWGLEAHGAEAYFVSLSFTLVAAVFFAYARRHEHNISQEAVIGIVYALGSASVVLVSDKIVHGSEHLKELLVGQLLWVKASDVFRTGAIYSVVGLLHYIFKKPLIEASFTKGVRNPFWDFVFYALFGVVITSSVKVAGVLQVFSYLIVPSVVGSLFFKTLKVRLFFGWALGVVLSFVGLALSYRFDLPSGATIVVLMTLIPVLLLLGMRSKA